MHRIYFTMKKKYSASWVFNPWLYSIVIAIFITTVEFYTKLNQDPDKRIIKRMIEIDKELQR
jgi:hypothetical protein